MLIDVDELCETILKRHKACRFDKSIDDMTEWEKGFQCGMHDVSKAISDHIFSKALEEGKQT